MTPLDRILHALEQAGCNPRQSGDQWRARCPAHDDHNPSLLVGVGDKGGAVVYCHAGCKPEHIVAALGLQMSDLMPDDSRRPGSNGKPKPNGKPMGKTTAPPPKTYASANEAVAELERKHGRRANLWTYQSADMEPVGLVVRWNTPAGRRIRPVSKTPAGWVIGGMSVPRPLYRLPELLAADPAKPVFVVEGEKCADAAAHCGLLAVTSAGGANAAKKTDWSPVQGRRVVILPDNDPTGECYATAVAQCCLAAGAGDIRIVRLAEHAPELPEKGDIADVLESPTWCGIGLGDAATPEDLGNLLGRLAEASPKWVPEDAVPALHWEPFPVEALPEPIRGFVNAGAKAIGCDQSYLALPLLTALAAAIGNTCRLELKPGMALPPILWGVIVGESGTGKTPAFTLAMRPVRERQRRALERYAEAMKKYEADLARWEKDMAAWKRAASGDPPEKPDQPQAERILVSDITVEALAPILLANPRGVLLARDELAGWIGSFDRYANKGKASVDMPHWLSMFNAESLTVDRKTGIPRVINVPHPAVCIAGGIQPAILQRALGLEHREAGLAARLLLAYPPRKVHRWTEAGIDPDAEAELARVFDRLFGLQPTINDDGRLCPRLIRLSADAKEAWIAYYNAHAVELADMVGDMAAAWAKLQQYAARLALVIHFVRWAARDATLSQPDIVDLASMNAGIVLASWFKHEARRVYAMLDESDTQREGRRLADWIRHKGGAVTAREVQQGCRWLKAPGAAEEALEDLVKSGYGTWQTVPASTKGGRPSRVFVLSARPPQSHEAGRDATVYNVNVYETSKKHGKNEGFVDVDNVDAPEDQPPGCSFAIRALPNRGEPDSPAALSCHAPQEQGNLADPPETTGMTPPGGGIAEDREQFVV